MLLPPMYIYDLLMCVRRIVTNSHRVNRTDGASMEKKKQKTQIHQQAIARKIDFPIFYICRRPRVHLNPPLLRLW